MPSSSVLDAVTPGRQAGVLAHLTSIPGATLEAPAYRFIDWMVRNGLSVWQMLPIAPVHASDRSPYRALSALAGEPSLIARDMAAVSRRGERREAFEHSNAHWLDDWATFMLIKAGRNHAPWWEWPDELRNRDPQALAAVRNRYSAEFERLRDEQYQFSEQWQALRRYAQERGVHLFGDVPIFVAHDSADVWASRELFQLTASGQPTAVAGVPPDAFSATGQRWGNPLYDWSRMADDGYRWWIRRFENAFAHFDLVRLDHFRGFEAYWSIPAQDPTAERGEWIGGPGAGLFDAVQAALGPLPLVAEDLGVITDEVRALRDALSLPGMAILQFAFDSGDDNPYLPWNIRENSVVYTGTHDNDTTLGWFSSLDDFMRERVMTVAGEQMPWGLIHAALHARSRLAIVPMQDWLGLGEGHRMNVPGVAAGNWRWRFAWSDVPDGLDEEVRTAIAESGRARDRDA